MWLLIFNLWYKKKIKKGKIRGYKTIHTFTKRTEDKTNDDNNDDDDDNNRHFKVRVSEHQGVSPRTGKPVKGTLSTSVRDHMLVCDHKVVHEDFKFLGNKSNRYLLELKESLL